MRGRLGLWRIHRRRRPDESIKPAVRRAQWVEVMPRGFDDGAACWLWTCGVKVMFRVVGCFQG